MKRTLLGSWSTPGGNSCDVFLVARGALRELAFEWDEFPLRPDDEVCLRLVILPAVARRAQEFLELRGRAVVVTT